uniref:MANSC domain-containing protein n=1 Tax=Amphiprion percula TaxID=161767 RepID=A0A3P8SAQ7_AMPPE
MNVAWGSLTLVLSLVSHTESRCSPTSYYKNCWIRRFPGIFIDIEESQRRGAQLLKFYQEETALKCSRTCCLTRNFSCNLAIFHYDTTQENVNCFHLHCPTLESCILSHRGNVVLYNITKGKSLHCVHTTTAAPQESSQLATVPTTALSSTEKTPPASGNYVQTTAPATSTTPLAPSFTTPLSSTPVTTLGQYNSETLPAFSTMTAQPSKRASTHHPTTTSFSQLATSPPPSTTLMGNMESSKQHPNETKGSLGRNHTAGSDGGQEGEEPLPGLGPGWHVAAHTLLVAVAICISVLLSCCCSVLLVVSWRGQRKRMGRYRTSWRGKRGSMRLIKYALVKENS